jgi:hypothetical protein
MHRANHGQWNTVWNDKDNGRTSARRLQLDALIDGEEQRRFGRVVIGGFLEATLNGRDEYRAIFRDHRTAGDWLPPSMYLTRYADANTQWLATFDEDVDVTTGTIPGVRIAGDSLSTWKEGDVPARSRSATFRSNAVTVGWNNTPAGSDTATPRWPARLTVTLSDSVRQAVGLDASRALLLTVGSTDQKPGVRRAARDTTKRDSTAASSRRPAAPRPKPKAKPTRDTVPPDFTVEVEDTRGRVARLPLSAFGAVRMPIESYIYRRRGRDKTQFPTLAEPVMQTYHMPLASFVTQNTEFDPSALRTIRLVFDRKQTGAVLLDDLGIAPAR